MTIRDNPARSRFEAVEDGHVAFLEYVRHPHAIVFVHTEVPELLRGRGIANDLAKMGIESARAAGLRLVVRCPFVRAYLRRHPNVTAHHA